MKKHLSIVVEGQVQGVFYRVSTKERCDQLGIAGWVRNEPDGTVRIEAEGEVERLNKLLDWCRKGSGQASVHRVTSTERPLEGMASFDIRYGQ